MIFTFFNINIILLVVFILGGLNWKIRKMRFSIEKYINTLTK